MQGTYKQIFDMAVLELPDRRQTFQSEEAVLYRGFKISKSRGSYEWKDTRYDNYYEPVDPKITEKVLKNGFVSTLTEVMHHNDKEKVLNISREIEKKDAIIKYWSKESHKIWTQYQNKRREINQNKILNEKQKDEKKKLLKRKYESDKDKYQKKRRVTSDEREDLKLDLKFYESRIKLYNN